MAKLTELINESKYLKREFGEALPTFSGVMKQHQENKFKEDLDAVGKEDDDVDNDGDSDASDDYLKNRRKVVAKAIEKESVGEDSIRKVIRQEIKSLMMKEDEEAFKQPIPATIERFMKKFITALDGKNLNRKRKLSILGRLVVALKLDPAEVSKYARLVKREL